jgi:cytoskeletal protein CcmA (bactofilin family)
MSLFKRRNKQTTIAEGLKIVGSVTAEGLVEVNGHIEGDLHCTALVVSPKAAISGGIEADRVVVNGRVEGPIRGGDVLLKSRAHVVGDIEHQTLAIEKGAFFDGRSVRSPKTNMRKAAEKPEKPEKLTARLRREASAANGQGHEAVPAA